MGIALSKFCGPDDVITPLFFIGEMTRPRMGYRGKQNLRFSKWNDKYKNPLLCKSATRKFMEKLIAMGGGKPRGKGKPLSANTKAAYLKRLLNPDLWNSYYKFCFERNPFDKLVADYLWYSRGSDDDESTGFNDYMASHHPAQLKAKAIYTINNKIAVDGIHRYENLATELEIIREKLGLPEKLQLPKSKVQFRENKGGYRNFFNEHQRLWVEKEFAYEMKLLGCRF